MTPIKTIPLLHLARCINNAIIWFYLLMKGLKILVHDELEFTIKNIMRLSRCQTSHDYI